MSQSLLKIKCTLNLKWYKVHGSDGCAVNVDLNLSLKYTAYLTCDVTLNLGYYVKSHGQSEVKYIFFKMWLMASHDSITVKTLNNISFTTCPALAGGCIYESFTKSVSPSVRWSRATVSYCNSCGGACALGSNYQQNLSLLLWTVSES